MNLNKNRTIRRKLPINQISSQSWKETKAPWDFAYVALFHFSYGLKSVEISLKRSLLKYLRVLEYVNPHFIAVLCSLKVVWGSFIEDMNKWWQRFIRKGFRHCKCALIFSCMQSMGEQLRGKLSFLSFIFVSAVRTAAVFIGSNAVKMFPLKNLIRIRFSLVYIDPCLESVKKYHVKKSLHSSSITRFASHGKNGQAYIRPLGFCEKRAP